MNKKYIVRLTEEERAICEATIKKETGKSEKLRRATILLKADADGPAFDLAAGLAMNVPGSALHVVHVFHAAPSAEMSQDLATHLRGYVNQKGSVARGLRGISLGVHLRAGRVVSV